MVQRKRSTTPPTDDHTQDAAAIILQHEQDRKERAKRKAKRKLRRAEKQHRETMAKMQESIDIIKKCVLAISTVMVIALLVGLYVLVQVRNEVELVKSEAERIKGQVEVEAERIKSEVEEITREAELIRDKIRHPLQTLGGALGRQLEGSVDNILGGSK